MYTVLYSWIVGIISHSFESNAYVLTKKLCVLNDYLRSPINPGTNSFGDAQKNKEPLRVHTCSDECRMQLNVNHADWTVTEADLEMMKLDSAKISEELRSLGMDELRNWVGSDSEEDEEDSEKGSEKDIENQNNRERMDVDMSGENSEYSRKGPSRRESLKPESQNNASQKDEQGENEEETKENHEENIRSQNDIPTETEPRTERLDRTVSNNSLNKNLDENESGNQQNLDENGNQLNLNESSPEITPDLNLEQQASRSENVHRESNLRKDTSESLKNQHEVSPQHEASPQQLHQMSFRGESGTLKIKFKKSKIIDD